MGINMIKRQPKRQRAKQGSSFLHNVMLLKTVSNSWRDGELHWEESWRQWYSARILNYSIQFRPSQKDAKCYQQRTGDTACLERGIVASKRAVRSRRFTNLRFQRSFREHWFGNVCCNAYLNRKWVVGVWWFWRKSKISSASLWESQVIAIRGSGGGSPQPLAAIVR